MVLGIFRNTFRASRFCSTQTRICSLISDNGTSSEISSAIQKIFQVAQVPITWDVVQVKTEKQPDETLELAKIAVDSIKKNKVCLMSPLLNFTDNNQQMFNSVLEKEFQLYANIKSYRSLVNPKTEHVDVDLVIVREITEGEYSGTEHLVVDGCVQVIKVTTETASLRIAECAFEYAMKHNRKKVTVVHRANYRNMSDGLFLKCCQDTAFKYNNIQFKEEFLDTFCVNIVQDPTKYDVLVMPNLYGDILSNTCASLVGGLGLTGTASVGFNVTLFEHMDEVVENTDQNNFNPTSFLLSSTMMLRHLKFNLLANRIELACLKTIKDRFLTEDFWDKSSVTEFTEAVCEKLELQTRQLKIN